MCKQMADPHRFLNKTSAKGNVTIKSRFASVPGILPHLNFALLRSEHFNGNSSHNSNAVQVCIKKVDFYSFCIPIVHMSVTHPPIQ